MSGPLDIDAIEGAWWSEKCVEHRADVEALVGEVRAIRVELAATRKAKAENDERFQNERDEARAEAARVRSDGLKWAAAVERLQRELDEARRERDRTRELLVRLVKYAKRVPYDLSRAVAEEAELS